MPNLERIGIHLSPTAGPDSSATATLPPGGTNSADDSRVIRSSDFRNPYAALHRMVVDFHTEPLPDHPLRLNEELPLSETDYQILDIIGTAGATLKTGIPSGLRFPGRIFVAKEERKTDGHGHQSGQLVAILSKDDQGRGVMSMVEALEENGYGEPDIDTACPVQITSPMIHHYAAELLRKAAERFRRVKIPDAENAGDTERIEAIKEDITTTEAAAQKIEDLLTTTAIVTPAQTSH